MKKFSKAIAFKAITLPVLAALLATTINVPFASAVGDSAKPKAGQGGSPGSAGSPGLAGRMGRLGSPRRANQRRGPRGKAQGEAPAGGGAGSGAKILGAGARAPNPAPRCARSP